MDGTHTSLFSSMHPAPLDDYHYAATHPLKVQACSSIQFFMLHLILTNVREDDGGYTWPETMKKRNNCMTQPNVQNRKPPETYLLKSGPDM